VSPNPPRLAERLVRWSLAPEERPVILGDLLEEFEERRQWADEAAASRWYWRQAITSFVPNLARRIRNDEEQRVRRLLILWGLCGQWLGRGAWTLWHSVPVAILASVALPAAVTLWVAITPRPPIAQQRALAPIFLLAMFATAVALTVFEGTPVEPALLRYVVPTLSALFIGVLAWPRWPADPPPAELFIRGKVSGDQNPRSQLTITVPNVALGMSGLVLQREVTPGADDDKRILSLAPTIDRTFDRPATLRVSSVIKTADAPVRVTCEVLDDSGVAARALAPTIDFNGLERLKKPWDMKPVEDPAPHVGRIDVTLPLAELAPGPYRIRVTTTDGTHAAQQEERITVR
jgi:hypothetical protein